MVFHGASNRPLYRVVHVLVSLLLMSGCSGVMPLNVPSAPASTPTSGPIDYPKTEVVFRAQLSSALPEGESLVMEFLDEVTGLAFNPAHARMEPVDSLHYTLTIPIAVGSVVKYRYVHGTEPMEVEYTSNHQQVRYRMAAVSGPGQVDDVIGGWRSALPRGEVGRVRGQVSYRSNNAPVVNGLVTSGGIQTLTASDGSFVLEGLTPGLHNLVVYSLDGSFQPFQQGAVIGPDATTPASIQVEASNLVNVTLVVNPPAGNMRGIPIRVIGNTLSLGNTFADLRGGVSALASRAPLMESLPDGRYTITMKLPAGMDLRYKYTLGDGFWNSERNRDGSILLRQLIVPEQDVTVEDTIATWKAGSSAPISFTVTAPANTPPTDNISIQFNAFAWTEPIPMWPLGNRQWLYVLYNPLDLLRNASYRFCRNDQCGQADALDVAVQPMQPGEVEQTIALQIPAWAWLESETQQVVVPNATIDPRDPQFMAGVSFLPGYHPSWQPYLGSAIQEIQQIGSNSLIISPTWHVSHQNPPVLEPVAGLDPLWLDLARMTVNAQQRSLRIVMHPVVMVNGSAADWWQSAPLDEGWWQTWFDRYRAFMISNADLAAQTGAEVLVIGDETIVPSLPGGLLSDGTPSNVPADMEARWRSLIAEIRAHYPGKLAWFVPYAGALPALPQFLADVDLLYVQMSPPFAAADDADAVQIQEQVTAMIDNDIALLQQQTIRPVMIGLQMPSASGALDRCVEDEEGDCIAQDDFLRPSDNTAGLELALEDQADVYAAVLSVLNDREWITGFFAEGFYPPVGLRDASVSIRNKPASDVLQYWYPQLTGQAVP